jgi:hypothetical protein
LYPIELQTTDPVEDVVATEVLIIYGIVIVNVVVEGTV